MSTSNEPISVRTTRLNNLILGHSKATSKTSKLVADGLNRECILDAMLLLYNECNKDQLKKRDKHILEFVSKFRPIIRETHSLRVKYDDFKVQAVIGKGYFGDVYLIKEKATGDIYSMKKIPKSDITPIQAKEERDIMACRESEWITKLQYAFQDCDHLYLVMEYLPGGDLRSLMSRTSAFDEDLAKFYLAELTLAINSLHCMGYVHRNIKPENILIDHYGHIKLADFGNAVALNKDGHANSQLLPIGTPDYVAPEILQIISPFKLSKSVLVACDYWSMGIIGYEMLCQITPFHEDNVPDIYSKILSHSGDDAPKILRYPPGLVLSSNFRNLIEGLVTQPDHRLTYLHVLSHSFFEGINWDYLRQIVPPIIPTLNDKDVISNFEDGKKVKWLSTFVKKSTIESVQSNDFFGHDLPFLGYGFVHEELAEESRSISGIELQIKKLKNNVNELQNVHKHQIKILQESILEADNNAESESTNKILQDAKEELNIMTERLKNVSVELAASKNERSKYKTKTNSLKIQEEISHRNEIKISDILTSTFVNKKSEKVDMVSDQNYTKILAKKTTELLNTTQKLSDCENELSTKYEECTYLQGNIENYKQMLKSVKEKGNSDQIEFEKNKMQLIEEYETKLKGLENKLRLAKDFRYKLSEELRNLRSELDKSICSLYNIRQAKLLMQKNIEDIIERLKKEIEENKNLRSKNAAIEKKETDLAKVCESLSKEIERLNQQHKLIEYKRKFEQESAYQITHGTLSDLSQVGEPLLESIENSVEDMITRLSEQPKSFGDMLEKPNDKLEDKLAAMRGHCVFERQSAGRDKKLPQSHVDLKEKNNKLQSDMNDIERKLNKTIKQKEAKIAELRDDIISLKTDLHKEHKMWEKSEQERMCAKLKIVDYICHVHKLEEKLEDSSQKLMHIIIENDSYCLENRRLMRELKEERESNSTLNENVTKIRMQLKSTQPCEITNSQVIELEKILDGELNYSKIILEKNDSLWKTVREKENEIAKLRILLINEASVKNVPGLDDIRGNFEMIHKQQISQQEQLIGKTTTVFTAQKKIEILSSVTSNMQIINENRNKEIIILLKEENSRILTELVTAKENVQKLDRKLKESHQSINELQLEIQQMNVTLSEQKNFYTQRDVKADAILAQHRQLIKYLQQQVHELSKRTGTAMKANDAPNSVEYSTAYRTLEEELQKERERNNQLNEQLLKSKIDIQPDNVSVSPSKKRKQKFFDKAERNKFEASCTPSLVCSGTSSSGSRQPRPYQKLHDTFVNRSKTGSVQPNDCSGQDLPFLGYGFISEDISQESKNIDGGASYNKNFNNNANELLKTHKQQITEIKILEGAEKKVIVKSDSLNKDLQNFKDELNNNNSCYKWKFQCSHCTKSFKCQSKLYRHNMVHNKLKMHSCPKCTKSFALRQHLERHMITHEAERLYFECNVCKTKVRSKQSLRIHKILHLAKLPFECKLCLKCFQTRTNLKKHKCNTIVKTK